MWRTIVISSVAIVLASTAPRALAGWPPGPEVGFTADVYPSAVDAARGLAPRLEGLVRDALGGRAPGRIHVAGGAVDASDAPVFDALAEAMRRGFGDGANVTTTPPAGPLGDDVVHVRPRVRRDANHNAPGTEQTFNGTVTITVHTATGERECAARFDEKPWLTDLERFKGQRPGRWVIGQADEPSA